VNDLLPIVVSGVAQGVPIFVVASGLTLIYGVLHILNFAHGAFFLIGAYVLATQLTSTSLGSFVITVLFAGLVVMLIGMACEFFVFRRLYAAGSQVSFLGAFALFLALQGAAQLVWGDNPRTAQYPADLSGATEILGAFVSVYDVAVMAVGAAVAVGLFLMLNKSSLGSRVRAVAQDRVMATALGIRAPRVSLIVFAIGSFLAGAAGALTAPVTSVDMSLAASYIVPAFVVVIVGGLGSIQGALLAALLLGVMESVLFRYATWMTGFSYYLLVAVILMFRPQGLFGSFSRTTQIAR